ncbi:hypothetical protein SAMN05444484_10129 [Flavobacterium chilense]|uniref:Uncharacterized protein n=1 Tax=Flavobacterium chilense TaxID=946677 RepID=A0A1M6X7L7_9FLAO|nr:hypothetical protein SAMN05444484_10129 [Flavobacterium chilense]
MNRFFSHDSSDSEQAKQFTNFFIKIFIYRVIKLHKLICAIEDNLNTTKELEKFVNS